MVSLVKGSEEEPNCCTAMTWYFSEQMYTMPSVTELPTESPPSYSSDQFMGQNQYVFAHSLDYHQESPPGRFGPQSFPYITQNSDSFGYYQQQYTPAISTHQHSCRDSPFVWIGTNNFYPSPPYEQRYLEDSYPSQQRQCYRRHHNSDRVEKTNNRKRRAPTVAQRRAANIRERRRMYNLNEAFDCLRQRIPTFAYEKRLSRIETLRLAISYISFMAAIVSGEDPNTLRVNTYDSPVCAASSMTQPSLRHGDSIPASQSCDNDEYDDDVDDDVSEDQTDDDNNDEEDNCKEDDEFQDGHSFHISNGDSYSNVMAKEV